MLALVVLAGVVPFSSLSSSHECGMACCAGKPPHLAGSCSTRLGNEEQAETPAQSNEEHSAHSTHTHSSGATFKTTATPKRRGAAKPSSTHHPASGREATRTASVSSQAMLAAPCSPACAAATLPYSQVRRPRNPASLAVVTRPRPPTLSFIVHHLFQLLPESAERRSLSRPRAPPFLAY